MKKYDHEINGQLIIYFYYFHGQNVISLKLLLS